MPGSLKWSPSLRSPHQNPACTSLLPHACYMPRPSHSSRFDYPINEKIQQFLKYLLQYLKRCLVRPNNRWG
jgi:hypothetical protein